MEIIIDFNGVKFVSRSFADELCNIADDLGNRISYVNMEKVVEEMITAVANSRKKEKERGLSRPRILQFNDVESLSNFIAEHC